MRDPILECDTGMPNGREGKTLIWRAHLRCKGWEWKLADPTRDQRRRVIGERVYRMLTI